MWDRIPGMASPRAREKILAAWKGGPEIEALRRQLVAMPDGGRFIIAVPLEQYRCPPAPYEGACLVADYFKRHKPRRSEERRVGKECASPCRYRRPTEQ